MRIYNLLKKKNFNSDNEEDNEDFNEVGLSWGNASSGIHRHENRCECECVVKSVQVGLFQQLCREMDAEHDWLLY